MNRSIIRHLLLTSSLLLVSPLVYAAGPNCAAMEESGSTWFASQLDKVQATYEGGDSQEAYQQLRTAMFGLPRSADVSLEARCVGPAGWERMYQLRREITQALGKEAEDSGRLAATGGALDWYVTGDNRGDAHRVIPRLTPTAKGTAYIINRLRNEIGLLGQAQESGFELLPEERSAHAFWQKDLDGIVGHAKKQGSGILDQEAELLSRVAAAKDEQLELAQQSQKTLIAGYLGDESLVVQNEARLEVSRAKASLELLGNAQKWLQAISTGDAATVRKRALVRGDALLARANDTSLSLEARDSVYEAADNYFEFAQDRQRRQAAQRGRTAIAPALQAERDARAARMDQRVSELEKSAQEMKQSMEKTDPQKQSFKAEADAMEDELGF